MSEGAAVTGLPSPTARPRRGRHQSLERRRTSGGARFIAPMVLTLGFSTLFPVGYSIWMSLHDWNWGQRFNFVGIGNYTDLLGSWEFWGVLLRTAYFAAGAVTVELALGLALAVAINRLRRGAGVVRAILIVPLMVSGIIVAIVWKVMLDPSLGVVPYLLHQVHLPTSAYFGDLTWAMPSVIGVDVWWQTGFAFIILSAGLAALPTEPFEAATVDGASAWQQFRYLTVPMLRPLIIIVAALRTVDCLKVFPIIFGTTGGGPGRVTETIQVMTYRTAFKDLQMSRAMTLMVLFSAIVAIGTAAFLWVQRRRVGRI